MRKLSTRFLTIVLAFAMIMPSIFVGTIPAIAEDVVADSEQVETLDNSTIITHSNSLANGVQAQFYDYTREQFEIKNQQMTLSYNLKEDGNKQVASLTNEIGTYFENTMDAFVTINGKERMYASDSSSAATANLHRLGYYYYDARFEGQDFITESTVMSEDVKKFWVSNVTDVEITSGGSKWSPGKVSGTLTNNNDPQIVFGNSDSGLAKSIEYSADTYNYIRIKMTVSEGITGAAFYYNDSSATGFTDSSKYVSFDVINDGTEQTYMVPMFNGSGYSGTIGHLRLDFTGAVGSTFTVSELAVVQVDTGDSIEGLQVARSFLVYSDKMHSFTQFATTKTVNNIENFGVEVKIPTANVGDSVVKENEYAGFYITDVGVFGYIMPADDSGSTLTVTVEDGYYVIRQTNTPTDGVLNPSEAGTDNGNDFYIGQRLYTDTNTTLDAFEIEAELERNPIPDENIVVHEGSEGSYVGYDALRGIYKFSIEGFDGFSEPAYAAVNKHFNVNFTITGDNNERKIWAMTATTGGCLESAVLLDANEMLIPVPIQVGKNFQEENTRLFSIDDTPYGEAIFPMDIKANSSAEYTVVNAYQNWGKYPLKQISWIQFSTPYYHLSTGVTESTCITPMYSTKSNTRTFLTLPDFRPMSAPYWSNAPQHNTCGDHRWLLYTDSNGNFNGTENYNNVITSHGPTYAEIEMQNISDDGSIRVTYTHMEMPQTDENRTYYQIKYEIQKDVSFTDFSRDFQFYSVESLDPTGLYQRVGYLDTKNESQVETAMSKGYTAQYVLGDECPYFSFFDMDNATSTHNNCGYSNVAFLIYNAEFNSDFKEGDYENANPSFVLNDLGGTLSLSLNLDEVTLEAGDTITINAILLPWGSQEMDGTYDTIQDQNVRDVRANTLLDPVVITPVENAEVVESVYLPRVKTTNGTDATFTISGGENNQTIRVDGFEKLTDPKIYEWSEEKNDWVKYVVCSASTPDVDGNGHSYDGYSVYYNSDEKYSYSFVTTLTGNQQRKFKVVADEDFDGWELSVASNASLQNMNVLYAGADLRARNNVSDTCAVASEVKTDETNGVSYIRFTPNANNRTDFYSTLYTATDPINTGKYVVVKYRLPSNSAQTGYMEVFTSTKNSAPVGGDNYKFENIVCDDKWHLVIFDIASYGIDTFEVSEDGTCLTKYMRIDFFNASNKLENGEYIDIAYVGMSDSISEILAYDTNYADAIMLYCADPSTGERAYSAITAPAENELVKINVASPTINPDDLFLVPVNIENNTGISYLDIMPVYNNEDFTFMGVVNGEVMDGLSRNGSHLIWSNTSNSTKNGTLVYLAFKAKAKTAMNEGDSAEFSVKVIDAMTTAADGVNTKVTAGSVTFKTFTYGNVDGSEDGKVNISDVVTLRKYIAGSGVSVDTAEADVNCDGVVDLKDITLLRQYMASYDYDTGESSVILGPQIKEGE